MNLSNILDKPTVWQSNISNNPTGWGSENLTIPAILISLLNSFHANHDNANEPIWHFWQTSCLTIWDFWPCNSQRIQQFWLAYPTCPTQQKSWNLIIQQFRQSDSPRTQQLQEYKNPTIPTILISISNSFNSMSLTCPQFYLILGAEWALLISPTTEYPIPISLTCPELHRILSWNGPTRAVQTRNSCI